MSTGIRNLATLQSSRRPPRRIGGRIFDRRIARVRAAETHGGTRAVDLRRRRHTRGNVVPTSRSGFQHSAEGVVQDIQTRIQFGFGNRQWRGDTEDSAHAG
jgi:hypothetical protein